MNDKPPDLAHGGAYAWQLPLDASGPPMARSLLEAAMTALGLEREVIEDGMLAVSETSTNAFQHGRPEPGLGPLVPPELWIWARTQPVPQLVVSVFDTARVDLPRTSGADLLDDHGKGLDLLGAFTAEWRSQLSRSRLATPTVRGKAVRFCLPLPVVWPGRRMVIPPAQAVGALFHSLAARGIEGSLHSDDKGISMLELPGLNVWVCPTGFSWNEGADSPAHHPLTDLQETAEALVEHMERLDSLMSP